MNQKTKLSVVRLGNILGSYGSVLPFFRKKKEEGTIPITDERMTRFSISASEAAEAVLWALENTRGGEIYVPKLPSYRLVDLADAVAPDCPKKFTGIRPGEKIHEELISEAESATTYDLDKYYAILSLSIDQGPGRAYPTAGGAASTPGISVRFGHEHALFEPRAANALD